MTAATEVFRGRRVEIAAEKLYQEFSLFARAWSWRSLPDDLRPRVQAAYRTIAEKVVGDDGGI